MDTGGVLIPGPGQTAEQLLDKDSREKACLREMMVIANKYRCDVLAVPKLQAIAIKGEQAWVTTAQVVVTAK